MEFGARYITKAFLKKIATEGRILDGLRLLEAMEPDLRTAVPVLSSLSSWECILEEVLDTDHEPEHYVPFAKTLLERGYSREEIAEMRQVAWETAGWYNFEMMGWDWCSLSESDMLLGLENRRKVGNLSRERYEELRLKIEHYRNPPLPPASL